MKAYLAEIVQGASDVQHGRHLAREYLQARILNNLQQSGAMVPLAFHGGTALRFLYQIPRYSEDLDFALERVPDRYDFRAYLKSIQSTLTAERYALELRINDRKASTAPSSAFKDCCTSCNYHPILMRRCQLNWRSIPTRRPARAWRQPSSVVTKCSTCNTTTRRRYLRGSYTQFSSGRSPRAATSTISSGICPVHNGHRPTWRSSTTPCNRRVGPANA